MDLDISGWSGEGDFTQTVIDHLKGLAHIAALKVEDAPASRSEADYNFLSNEIFVTFATVERREPVRRLGIIPGTKRVTEKGHDDGNSEHSAGGCRRHWTAGLLG